MCLQSVSADHMGALPPLQASRRIALSLTLGLARGMKTRRVVGGGLFIPSPRSASLLTHMALPALPAPILSCPALFLEETRTKKPKNMSLRFPEPSIFNRCLPIRQCHCPGLGVCFVHTDR